MRHCMIDLLLILQTEILTFIRTSISLYFMQATLWLLSSIHIHKYK